ncbi:hypothetical protein FOZ63_005785, partial [Perkinsus olseni]
MGWQRCPWTINIVNDKGQYLLEVPTDHPPHQRIDGQPIKAPSLSTAAKRIVDEDAANNVPPWKTMRRLDREGILLPSDNARKQVYNRRYASRAKTFDGENGPGKTFHELRSYVESLPYPPTDDTQAFCVTSSLELHGDYYAYFSCVSLLRNYADSPLLTGDYTMGLSWVGIPTLQVGSHSKRGSFQLLAIGYSSRQDSAHVAAAMRAIKEWCVENQIVHEPFILLADSAGCFSSAFKAVHGPFIPDSLDSDYRLVPPTSASTSTTGGLTQGNIRIHCHVHFRYNINKALNKYIKPSNTSETKWAEDEKKRFRSAIAFLQNISSERHFGIACQLMTAAWKRHHEDLVKYFEENWLQRKCIWAQG